jgi:hypothetical protein
MPIRMTRLFLLLLLLTAGLPSIAQDNDLLLNHDLYHYIDRIDIRGYTGDVVHTDMKPYGRDYLADVLNRTETASMKKNERFWHDRVRVLVDDKWVDSLTNKGLWNFFYTNPRDLYQVQTEKFRLFVNPVMHFGLGTDIHTFDPAGRQSLFTSTNSRGVVVRGSFLDKIGFYTEVYDNVVLFPQFIINRYQETETLPGEAFIKEFKPDTRTNGLDFFSSRAYITFSPLKEMRIKFGKDRAFWGNGYQSLFLSDNAADYLMLSVTTRIWQLEYTNHFTQMIDFIPNKNDRIGTYPRKYAVFHQLNWKPTHTISIGVFESIVYSPWQPNGRRGFEIQYLNPIIFYRSVEQALGSPDNTFIGLQAKFNFLHHFQAYGHFLLDDFNVSKFREASGYWGNKFGYQAGLKYIDAFSVPTLDLQVEYNNVRPYTYQHFNISANYANYGQSLGHAAGANLRDLSVMVRYHPLPAWNLFLAVSRIQQGLDEYGINYGSNINLPYTIGRPQYSPDPDFGHTITQGRLLTINQVYGRLSWQLFKTDIYAEVEGRFRQENEVKSLSVQGGLRANLPSRAIKY